MSNQVGQVKSFVILGTPFSGSLAYVYRFWDQTVAVTTNGTAVKQLNIGGNPADAYLLRFTCEVCDALGNSQVLGGSLGCNNPPTIVPSPTVSQNNAPYPYQTQIVVQAYDLEEAGAINFYWYQGTNPLPSGATLPVTSTPGTYAGTVTGVHLVYQNTMVTTVAQTEILTLQAVDANSGTTALNFLLTGYQPGAPQFSVSAQPDTLTANAATLPTQQIGNLPVNLTAYASDVSAGALAFYWAFYGTNGWTQPGTPFFSTGTTTPVVGGYQNNLVQSIANEVGSGQRTVDLTVTNTVTGRSVQAQVQLDLVVNPPPVIASVDLYDAVSGNPLGAEISRSATPVIRLSGTATDANANVVVYAWTLTQPVSPAAFTLYGHDINLDISGYPNGLYNPGTVVATDRLGTASAPFTVPQLNLIS